MTNPYTHAALAEDRRKTLMAQANRRRLPRRWIARFGARVVSGLNKGTLRPSAGDKPAATAREPSLAAWIDSISERAFIPAINDAVRHRGESGLLIRPIDAGDGALLADGFERLSPRSRRLRFLGTKKTLSQAELDHLTNVDHRNQEALVALSRADGRGVGVARYTRDSNDSGAAELAVAVVDEWHRRGVGSELIQRLIARAKAEDIQRFTALISNDNIASINLLRSLNLDVTIIDRAYDTTEYQIALVAAKPAGATPLPRQARQEDAMQNA